MCWRLIPCGYLHLQEFFFSHSEGWLILSLMVSFAVQMLLFFFLIFIFIYFFIIFFSLYNIVLANAFNVY